MVGPSLIGRHVAYAELLLQHALRVLDLPDGVRSWDSFLGVRFKLVLKSHGGSWIAKQ